MALLSLCFSFTVFGEVVFHDSFDSPDAFQRKKIDVWSRSISPEKVLTSQPLAFDGNYILKYLSIFPRKQYQSSSLYKKDIKLPAGQANRFDILFKFRHTSKITVEIPIVTGPGSNNISYQEVVTNLPSFFDLVFRSSDRRETQTVRIDTSEIAGAPIPWDQTDEWNGFAMKADGNRAAIYYSAWGPLEKLCEIPLEIPCASVNFKVQKGNSFDLADFMIATPQPLPRDPVEKCFADFRSLNQPIANARTVGPEGKTLALMPSPRSGIRFSPGEGVSKMMLYYSSPNPGGPGEIETHEISVKGQDWQVLKKATLGIQPGDVTNLPDAGIDFKDLYVTTASQPCMQFVRPSLEMYQSDYMLKEGYEIVRAWDSLPSASDHPLDVDFVRCADGKIDMYLDGSLLDKSFPVNDFNGTYLITNIVFSFAPGVRYAVKKDALSKVDTTRFTLLDLSANPRAKTLAGATSCTLSPGVRDFSGIPVNVARPIDSADVAICKQALGGFGDESDAYHGRSPLHGFPSAIHFRLAAAPFARAHLLFVLDPDPRKDPILTIRMAHYVNNGSGRNMLADTVVDLSGGKIPSDYEKVGTVEVNGTNLPVYRAAVDLDLGDFLDLLTGDSYDGVSTGKYIDFEFLGRGSARFPGKPDPDSDSAFNILGVTLEKMPFEVGFSQKEVGNVFNSDDKDRRTSFVLTSLGKGGQARGKIAWTIRDVRGKELTHVERDFSMGTAGTRNVFDLVLDSSAPVGYYPFELTISTPSLTNNFTHSGAFAVLPPAKREVDKMHSPYGIWWFSAHGSPGEAEVGGAIMQKAGIVRSGSHTPEKADLEKYNLTTARIHRMLLSFDFENGTFNDVPVGVPDPENPGNEITVKVPSPEAAEINLRKALAEDPTIDTVMFWHEDAPSFAEECVPEEILGLPVPEIGDKGKASAMQVNTAGEIVRRVAKDTGRDLRLQIGNSTTSIGAVVWPLRQGANPDYYDAIGIETPSQSVLPESLNLAGLQGMVITREIADYYITSRPAVLNGCFEFTYRCDNNIGAREQAEWYMRDILISLANRFTHVSPGILFDCKTAYYDTIWGASGMLCRSPFCYPKQAYVAYGVLTSALDGVRFVRQRDTGSTTVYAIEFKRADGKIATALWAARGEVRFSLDATGSGTATHMLGEVEPVHAGLNFFWGGTSPMYVVTDEPLKTISIADRAFREDENIADRAIVADPMSTTNGMTLSADRAYRSWNKNSLPIFTPSDFTLSQVDDPEKGPCVEVTLGDPFVRPGSREIRTTDFRKPGAPNVLLEHQIPVTNHYVVEYTTLRFDKPRPVPGKPVILGVWVKGNSNWGKIRFEVEDADGEVFKNRVRGDQDWPCNLAVDFDGWSYVYTALTEHSYYTEHSVGLEKYQWISDEGPHANHVIDYPIKVRAITIPMSRNKLDLLDFKPSARSIRLCNIGGTEEKKPFAELDPEHPVDPDPEHPVDPDPEHPVDPDPEHPIDPDPEHPGTGEDPEPLFHALYVSDAIGKDTNNGRSWTKAFKTIGAALDVAVDGDTISVTNGVYQIHEGLSITKAVVLRSVNGCRETEIRGDETFRLMFMNHEKARVSGFTLSNGRGRPETPGACFMIGSLGGVVEDCLIKNCTKDWDVPFGTVVRVKGGKVVRCYLAD